MIEVRRVSLITGISHTRYMDITEQQLADYEARKLGMVQHAFPHLSDDDREFILNGITPEEWTTYMSEEA